MDMTTATTDIPPNMSEYNAMMSEAQQWAKEVGMTEDDIAEAIKEARKAGKICSQ